MSLLEKNTVECTKKQRNRLEDMMVWTKYHKKPFFSEDIDTERTK